MSYLKYYVLIVTKDCCNLTLRMQENAPYGSRFSKIFAGVAPPHPLQLLAAGAALGPSALMLTCSPPEIMTSPPVTKLSEGSELVLV